MKRIDFLLTQARRMTNNEDFGANSGIPNAEIIPYLNYGQDRLFGKIVVVHPGLFEEEKEISAVLNQEEYELPRDVYLQNKVTLVEFSPTGLDDDYYPLKKGFKKDRSSGSSGHPSKYILRSGKFLTVPVPDSSTGKFRVSYVRNIQKLDIRRGRVSAVTLDATTKTITSLTLDAAETNFDPDTINENDHICIINRSGEIQMAGVLIDSLDDSTGVVSVSSEFVYETGESIAVGDYVVVGENASTHSELPDNCEGYLVEYLAKKINFRDSSDDFIESLKELKYAEEEIVESFAEVDEDITYVAEINEDY